MNKVYDYSLYMHSPEMLANEVLKQYTNTVGKLTYPIDPFKILNILNVKVLMKEFDKIEGLFIPANTIDDIDLVAINQLRPLFRQRFTAAHEICHVIKDKDSQIFCPIAGRKNEIEKFADKFASALLMPVDELKEQVDKYLKNGYIPLESVMYVAEYFGVSFSACVYNIAYKLNKIEGNTEYIELEKKIKKLKPNTLRKKIIIEGNLYQNDLNVLRNQIDAYCYFMPKNNHATQIKVKQYLILNENRLEGVDVSELEINNMLADIRLHRDYEKYKSSDNKNILQALGNIELIEYVLNTDDDFSIWKIFNMQKLLFKYTPFGHMMGTLRQSNNRISGSEVSTVDCTKVAQELSNLDEDIRLLLNKINSISITDYIRKCSKIHHRFTVIHPLDDGNGRVSRAILIWLFRLKKLPPIYIENKDKIVYLEALNKGDQFNNYDALEELMMKQILKSMIIFNENLFLSDESIGEDDDETVE